MSKQDEIKTSSVSKASKKTKVTKEKTLDDVVKAIENQGKTFSDALGKVSSSNDNKFKKIVENTVKDLNTSYEKKLKDIIKSSNSNIEALLKEIKELKTKKVADKEERQRFQRDKAEQKDMDKHAESEAKVNNLNAKTNQIIEKTAQDQQKFGIAYKKEIDNLNNSNKKAEQNFKKATEDLQFTINKHQIDLVSMLTKERREQEKHIQAMNERIAKELRESDKHQAWKEDRDYILNKRNTEQKAFSFKDWFNKKDNKEKTTANTNNSEQFNAYKQNYTTNDSSFSNNQSYDMPNFTMHAENTNSDYNKQTMSFTDIEEKYQKNLGDLQSKINDQAKTFTKDMQDSRLRESKILENESKIINEKLKAETDTKVKLQEIELKVKQQDFEQKAKMTELWLKGQKQEVELKALEKSQSYKFQKAELDIIAQRIKIDQGLEKFNAWQEDREYELEQRKKADEANRKESYKNSLPYRAVGAVQGAHTGFGTSVLMSALTGGALNSSIIQAFKLDKLMTAPVQALTRALFNDRKKSATEYTTSSAVKKSKNADILAKMDTITGKLDKLTKPKEEKTEKAKKGIFSKLGDLLGGLGTIAKGLGAVGIALLIKKLFPKTIHALNEKFKGMLTDTLGFSESTAEGIDQLIKDAIPGAIFGYTIGGFKGMLVGAGLTMAGGYIKSKWDEWRGNSEKDSKPKKIGPIPLDYAEAMIAGSAMGSLFGFKGMLIGALVGLAGQGLYDLGQKLGEWTANAVIWIGETWEKLKKFDLVDFIKDKVKDIAGKARNYISKIPGFGWLADEDDTKNTDNKGTVIKSDNELTDLQISDTTRKIREEKYQQSYDTRTDEEKNQSLAPVYYDNKHSYSQDLYTTPTPYSYKNVAEPTNKVVKASNSMVDKSYLGDEVIEFSIDDAKYFYNGKDISSKKLDDLVMKEYEAYRNQEGIYELTDEECEKYEKMYIDPPIANLHDARIDVLFNQRVKDIIRQAVINDYLNNDNTKKVILNNNDSNSNNDEIQVKYTQQINDISAANDDILLKYNVGTSDNILPSQNVSSLSQAIKDQTSSDILGDTKGLVIDSNNNLNTTGSDVSADMGGTIGSTEIQASEGDNGNHKTHIVNGIPAVSMKDLGLSGEISSINSKPFIAPNNVDNLKTLDKTISSWGYDVIYTSAMGGSHAGGPRSHSAGQKVDLQLKKNGKPTRMTPGQENSLISAGFARNGTGALGWEPVAGQVLGGHYDYSVGGGKKGQPSSVNDEKQTVDNTNNYTIGTTVASNDNLNTATMMMSYSNTSSAAPNDIKTTEMTTLNNNTGIVGESIMNEFEPGSEAALNRLFGTNSSPDIQKLETNNIPSIDTANVNELAQLNNTLSGNNNDNSLTNIMANVAENTANNQNTQPSVIYNNISSNNSDDDKSAYPVGDVAKTLLYA